MTVRDSRNDVLGAESSIAAKENLWMSRLKSRFIDDGHFPFVEFDAEVTFDPRKSIFLPDRDKHVVGRVKYFWLTGWNKTAFTIFVVNCLDLFEHHAFQPDIFNHKGLRNMIVYDRYVFVLSVLFFPRRSFHIR